MPGLLSILRKTANVASNPVGALTKQRQNSAQNNAYDDFMNTDYGSFKDSNGNYATPGSGFGGQPVDASGLGMPQTNIPNTTPGVSPPVGGLKDAAVAASNAPSTPKSDMWPSDSFGNQFAGGLSISRSGEAPQPAHMETSYGDYGPVKYGVDARRGQGYSPLNLWDEEAGQWKY